ncbi:class I SAM-dependent methyltransferase [Telmatobacter sp. DSM 110680]|uniref:Class I SAM-dependent methyltransferase n=1 Tax=Telmatobacter sp. DSM 110680 TaxID=3036704 RepID=A0AAU7DIT6_9BACT
MNTVQIPADLDAALDEAWAAAKDVPGFLLEQEARFLGTMAVCAPRKSVIVEIGSFKGKSTVLLGKLAQRYGIGPIVAIDPHTFHNVELAEHRSTPGATSFDAFQKNLETAGVASSIEVHRAFSSEVAASWSRPIGLLWIDGDHSYAGAKSDFDGFIPCVLPNGLVALHDALHEFSGPIRVFVEDMLRSDRFGAAGFVHSIAWSQFRPDDGANFRTQRATLERSARRLLPFVADEQTPHGPSKLLYKLNRSRVPRSLPSQQQWAALLGRP